MKMYTEKVLDEMGNTKYFKVKNNDKTFMKLDKGMLRDEMEVIKAGSKKAKPDDSLLSRITKFISRKREEGQ